MDPKDLDQHWQWLREQPLNTAVKLLRKDRVEDGRIMGTRVREGVDLLEIKTRKGVCLFPRGQAAVVRLAPESAESAQMLTRRVPAPPLLSALRTDTAAVSFMSGTRVDCAIVGTATSIAADLTWEGFQAGDAGPTSAAGTLQDVVRANGVAGAALKYRTKVVPSVADAPDQDAVTAGLAIFDGGRGYVQMRDRWPRAHQLIVIDQAYAGAQDVADAVNARFLKRDATSDVLGVEHPCSVEAIAFEEALG